MNVVDSDEYLLVGEGVWSIGDDPITCLVKSLLCGFCLFSMPNLIDLKGHPAQGLIFKLEPLGFVVLVDHVQVLLVIGYKDLAVGPWLVELR